MRLPALVVPAFASLLLSTVNARVFQKPLPDPINGLEPVISAESLDMHYRLHPATSSEPTSCLFIYGTILDKLSLQAIVLTAPYKSELVRGSTSIDWSKGQEPAPCTRLSVGHTN